MVYKKESHLRSIIKGFTWRTLAILDTILVVLLVTCLTGNCSIESALKIGVIEFFIKFLVYYIYERIWQTSLKDGIVTKKETLYKSIIWRLVATIITFIISGTILESFNEIVLYIALTELFTKFVLYYLHERIWLKLPLGRIRNFFFNKKG